LTAMRRETIAQFVDDPSAGTPGTLDTCVLGTKVWFINGNADDDFHRVHMQTLRTPS